MDIVSLCEYTQHFLTNTYTIKITPGGYEPKKQNISVQFFLLYSLVFFWFIPFIYSTFVESLLYAKHYFIFIYVVK